MLTDSNGAAYQSYSYDAWGKVTARDASGSVIASSAISAPWLFTGRRFDRESGLYHYRARTYSAELGRFLQIDPIKFDAGDPNIYRYVGNDPVNGTDPWGLSEDSYEPDNKKHGGPHVDRYDKNGKNVGRYRKDGSPIEHKGKCPPEVPNSDWSKFLKAAGRLNVYLFLIQFTIQELANEGGAPGGA
jgi:RHS repeat-associated protein